MGGWWLRNSVGWDPDKSNRSQVGLFQELNLGVLPTGYFASLADL